MFWIGGCLEDVVAHGGSTASVQNEEFWRKFRCIRRNIVSKARFYQADLIRFTKAIFCLRETKHGKLLGNEDY